MDCADVVFTGHATARLFERGLGKDDAVSVIHEGEVIQSYPDDRPYPSYLVLGRVKAGPVHVLIARDGSSRRCYVVTAYVPDPGMWTADFRRKLE